MRKMEKLEEGTPRSVFTVEEFCEAHRISRSMLYQLWGEGIGPRRMAVGAKVLISIEAAADWRLEREAASNPSKNLAR